MFNEQAHCCHEFPNSGYSSLSLNDATLTSLHILWSNNSETKLGSISISFQLSLWNFHLLISGLASGIPTTIYILMCSHSFIHHTFHNGNKIDKIKLKSASHSFLFLKKKILNFNFCRSKVLIWVKVKVWATGMFLLIHLVRRITPFHDPTEFCAILFVTYLKCCNIPMFFETRKPLFLIHFVSSKLSAGFTHKFICFIIYSQIHLT